MSVKDERERSLYIRFPRRIKDIDEVRDLVNWTDCRIKLPRQASRHCHIVFPTINDRIKHLNLFKEILIDNKPLFFVTPKLKYEIKSEDKKKKKFGLKVKRKKKILDEKSIKIEPDTYTKILYVSNINPVSKLHHLREALGECKSLTFLKRKYQESKTKVAIVKLKDQNLARQYLKRERPAPVLHGNKLKIKPDKRHRRKGKKEKLKIYGEDDKDVDIKEEIKVEIKEEEEEDEGAGELSEIQMEDEIKEENEEEDTHEINGSQIEDEIKDEKEDSDG